MSYLHKNDVLHRSLSPKNVLLDSSMNVRVKDYGMITVKDDITRQQKAVNPRFPIFDSQYSAPEVLAMNAYDGKADVYSFGILVWEMFAGEAFRPSMMTNSAPLKDVLTCPFPIMKLLRVCASSDPTARPAFDTILKIFNQPLDVLLKYARPPPETNSETNKPLPQQQHHQQQPQSNQALDEQQRTKLQKVFSVLTDLIKTPSDAAQTKAVTALEELSQKEVNISAMVDFGFVPNLVELMRSKFNTVQEHFCRILPVLLKHDLFARAFVGNRGIELLLGLLTNSDDGVRLVALKALTMAAYSTPEMTRSSIYNVEGHNLIISLLRSENEFVKVQTTWALGHIVSEKDSNFTPYFLREGGVAILEQMILSTRTSPAIELRALGALAPLYGRDEMRNLAATQPNLIKKISVLTASPQVPIRVQALLCASRLSAHHSIQDVLVKQGIISSIVAFLSNPPAKQNNVIMAIMDMLLLLVDSPDHFSELKRVGVIQALGTYLTWDDENIQDSARTLYNLFI